MNAPVWSEDGTKAVITARAADNKDRWIFALDPATGKTRVLVNIHDDAWVGGPQGAANTLGWMKNDREVYFISEKTGYAQLYAVAFDGGEPRALTTGNWEVLNVRQSQRQIQVLPHRQRRWPLRPVPLRNARRRRPAHPHLQGARQAHRRALTRRALHRRPLLLLQQAARSLRAGEPSAAGSQAPHHFALARVRAVRLAGPAHRDGARARRHQGPGAPVQARQLQEGRPRGDLRPRLRLSAERGS